MMTGGPAFRPKTGFRKLCYLIPRAGVLQVGGTAPGRSFEEEGEMSIEIGPVSALFELSMDWDLRGNAQVGLERVEGLCGIGFRVGGYPGVTLVRDTKLLRKSGTLEDGARLTGSVFGGTLTAKLSWSARLEIATAKAEEDRLQTFGEVALPCRVRFGFSRIENWRDSEGTYYGESVSFPRELPLGELAGKYSFEGEIVDVPVGFEMGWALEYPGFALNGMA